MGYGEQEMRVWREMKEWRVRDGVWRVRGGGVETER